jgi:hypothetical protein
MKPICRADDRRHRSGLPVTNAPLKRGAVSSSSASAASAPQKLESPSAYLLVAWVTVSAVVLLEPGLSPGSPWSIFISAPKRIPAPQIAELNNVRALGYGHYASPRLRTAACSSHSKVVLIISPKTSLRRAGQPEV